MPLFPQKYNHQCFIFWKEQYNSELLKTNTHTSTQSHILTNILTTINKNRNEFKENLGNSKVGKIIGKGKWYNNNLQTIKESISVNNYLCILYLVSFTKPISNVVQYFLKEIDLSTSIHYFFYDYTKNSIIHNYRLK